MKYITLLFIVSLHLPVSGQPSNFSNRKSEIERFMEQIYSVKEFQVIADSLQMSIDELSDYPVIFPIKKPQRISLGYGYNPGYGIFLEIQHTSAFRSFYAHLSRTIGWCSCWLEW